MKKFLFLVLVIVTASMALAQGRSDPEKADEQKLKLPQVGKRTSDPEEYEIEMAMAKRMVAQQDQWFHDGDFPAIISALRYQAEAWPFDEESASNLGWMLGNVGKKDEEIAIYLKFAHANPDNPDAPFSAGNFYYLRKDYVMAVKMLAPTVKMSRRPHPNNFRLLAHGYQRLGFLNEALQAWDLYLPLAPQDLAGYMNRNRVAVLLGKPEVHPKV